MPTPYRPRRGFTPSSWWGSSNAADSSRWDDIRGRGAAFQAVRGGGGRGGGDGWNPFLAERRYTEGKYGLRNFAQRTTGVIGANSQTNWRNFSPFTAERGYGAMTKGRVWGRPPTDDDAEEPTTGGNTFNSQSNDALTAHPALGSGSADDMQALGPRTGYQAYNVRERPVPGMGVQAQGSAAPATQFGNYDGGGRPLAIQGQRATGSGRYPDAIHTTFR